MIKQFLKQEICLRCLGCCRFSHPDSLWSPHLLDEEIEELLKNNIPPSVISSCKKIQALPTPEQNSFICAFLNTGENKCKIYSLRPFECQLYPFLISKKGKKVFLALDLKCPFAQENLETEILKEYTQYLVGLLNSPQGLNTLRANPQIIQEYPEVLGLAELKI